MKTRDQSRLANSLTLLVGLWVALSPMWVPVSGAALVSVVVTGLVIVAASIVQFFTVSTLPSWTMGAAAAWLLVSAVFYGVGLAAMWSQVLSALAVIGLAYWDGVEVSHMHHEVKHHHATPMM